MTRGDVVTEARTWIGVRYEHQHRDRIVGVDCVGLVIAVARGLGLVAPDFDVTGYERIPDGKTLLALCDAYMDRRPMEEAEPGDVLVVKFQREHPMPPQHMGILGDYLHGGLSLIQAFANTNGQGRVIEGRLEERRGWRAAQAYSLRGI